MISWGPNTPASTPPARTQEIALGRKAGLAVLLGAGVQPGLTGMMLMRAVELTGALAALMGLFLLPVLVTDWAVSGWGAPLTHTEPGAGAFSSAVYALLVLPFVALMVAAVSHALARCAGTVVAIVVAVAGLLEGVLVGGNDILSRSFLWLAAPWAWVQVAAQYPQRWPVVALLSLVIALASLGLAAGLGRRVALRD